MLLRRPVARATSPRPPLWGRVGGAALAAFTMTLLAPLGGDGLARADSMDPALNRLVLDPTCRLSSATGGVTYNPATGFNRCQPDNGAWSKLVAQYGAALAATAMHSARTTGYGGFEIAVEGAYTTIDRDQPYWRNGTQGPRDPSSQNDSVLNDKPDGVLQTYMFKLRKGFPFGLELMGTVGFMANTSIVVGGADVRWSLFEGFRTGIPAVFPELAIGGSVRTITGTDQMQVTVASGDAQLSKPIPIAGVAVLTPYVGYQPIFIFGDSGTIDFTPNTDPQAQCGYVGSNTPVTPDPNKGYFDGQPVCGAAGVDAAADFNNNVVFDPVRMLRHRINFGLQLKVAVVKVGLHFLTDLTDLAPTNQDNDDFITDVNTGVRTNKFEGVGKQWTIAWDLGANF
jgi:hypothetical protein